MYHQNQWEFPAQKLPFPSAGLLKSSQGELFSGGSSQGNSSGNTQRINASIWLKRVQKHKDLAKVS